MIDLHTQLQELIIRESKNKTSNRPLKAIISQIINEADLKLQEIMVRMIIIDNYKYLYAKKIRNNISSRELSMMIEYEKGNIEKICEVVVHDDNIKLYSEVLENVINLYLYHNNEISYIDTEIKEKGLEYKFRLFDQTYMSKKEERFEFNKNLEKSIEIIKEKYMSGNDIIEETENQAELLYKNMMLLELYDKKYKVTEQREMIIALKNFKNADTNLTEKDKLFLIQSKDTLNAIDLIKTNEEYFKTLLSDYMMKKVSEQKSPTM